MVVTFDIPFSTNKSYNNFIISNKYSDMLNTPTTGKSLRERRNQKLTDLNLSVHNIVNT